MVSSAVLFDFDGTLADTAADLSHALNRVRAEHRMEPLPVEQLRPHASAGARGLLAAGMAVHPEHGNYKALRERFLEHYAARICAETQLFEGMERLLSEIEARSLAWGIVTNKSAGLTQRVVRELGLEGRPACVVCGDTTPHLKPHPASLLHAAAELGLEPARCTYLGDDLRDIQAARAAGMRAMAVAWGFGERPHEWNADVVLARPSDLLAHL